MLTFNKFIIFLEERELNSFEYELKRRMSFTGMWRGVALALTDVSEESIASIFRIDKFQVKSSSLI
jgi:hypothetical protein